MLTLFVASDLYGDTLQHAATLEQEGHAAEAAALYRTWLSSHAPSAAWDGVLFRSVRLASNPQEAVHELLGALSKLTTNTAKHEAYVRIGRIDLLLGNLNGAQESFQNASLVAGGPKDFESLLESARLLVQLGRLEKADAQARSIVATCQASATVSSARSLLAKIDAIQGKTKAADAQIARVLSDAAVSGLSPQSLVNLYQAAKRLGLLSQEKTVANLLTQYYPQSPEAGVVAGRVSSVPTPAGLLGFSPGPYTGKAAAAPHRPASSPSAANGAAGRHRTSRTSVDIQIGSYHDRKNATYRLNDLENAGFSGSILKADVGGETYYRVVVPGVPLGRSQHVLVKLKEKGFEGFLLYE